MAYLSSVSYVQDMPRTCVIDSQGATLTGWASKVQSLQYCQSRNAPVPAWAKQKYATYIRFGYDRVLADSGTRNDRF